MNETAEATRLLREFVEAYKGTIIESTGFSKVTATLPVYNVIGSTDDPKIPKFPTWKLLLEGDGFKGCSCFVPGVKDRSHPGFDVGGHMTNQADGSVKNGTCYLMPLCKLHNGKGFEKVPFNSLTSTTMLQLTGYKPKDIAATFLARLSGDAPAALIYRRGQGIDHHRLLDRKSASREKLFETLVADGPGQPEDYLVLERVTEKGRAAYRIVEADLD